MVKNDEWLREALKKKKEPYDCGVCGRWHKYGTKVWEKDLWNATRSGVSQEVKIEAERIEAAYRKKIKEKEEKYLSEGKKSFPRYKVFSVDSSYGFRSTGREAGYHSYAKALEDNKYGIDKAKKGKGFVIIAEMKIVKILGKK